MSLLKEIEQKIEENAKALENNRAALKQLQDQAQYVISVITHQNGVAEALQDTKKLIEEGCSEVKECVSEIKDAVNA